MAHASFNGLRVLSLESRRAKEVAKLIQTYGGEPFVVPAMREIPLATNGQALEFARRLMAGEFDLVVCMTGVGVRALVNTVATQYDREEFLAALRRGGAGAGGRARAEACGGAAGVECAGGGGGAGAIDLAGAAAGA